MPELPTLIFVHGALVRDADWWWQPMRAPLEMRGIASLAARLPSCGEGASTGAGLADDVRAVRDLIDRIDGPVALLGHSYGGMVITDAGADDRVRRLIYLTSVMPEVGQSQGALTGDLPAPWVVPGPDGTVSADPELIGELFLQDCDEQTVAGALTRLTSQPLSVFTQAPEHAAWQDKPTTYIVCTRDLATPEEVQRSRVLGEARIVAFDAGHHPFLSRPEQFAELLAHELAASALRPNPVP